MTELSTRANLPDSFSKMLPVASTPEGIEYAQRKVLRYLEVHKLLDNAQDLIVLLEQRQKHVNYLSMASKAWSGDLVESSEYKRLHKAIAEEEAKGLRTLDSKASGIEYRFSIDDKACFLRAYNQAKGALSSEEKASLDALFNAWLASNDLVNKDGIISKADDMGKPIEAVEADEFKKYLQNSKSGYAAYLKEKGLELNVVEHTPAPTDSEIAERDRVISEFEAVVAQFEKTASEKHQNSPEVEEPAASKSTPT